MVPPASDRVPRVRPYSGVISLILHFAYRALTSYGCAFQNYSAMYESCFMMIRNPVSKLTVWPLSRSLAATRKIAFAFSSYGYLDVSVPRVPFSVPMCSVQDTYALPYVGTPIRISAGLWICAPHRSFSQLITSFFGSQCQGIPLMLLLT